MKVKLLSRVQLLATPWTAAHQVPPSMGFSRQQNWSGVPLQDSSFFFLIKEMVANYSVSEYLLFINSCSCLIMSPTEFSNLDWERINSTN